MTEGATRSAVEDIGPSGPHVRLGLPYGGGIGLLRHGSYGQCGFALAPDARTVIATRGDGVVRVWNVATGAIERIVSNAVGSVLATDGERVAVGSGSTIGVWSLDGA